MLAHGAPSNAELLQLWQHVAPSPPAPSRRTSRKSSRLSRLFSFRGGQQLGPPSSGGGAGARLARWLSGSASGRGLSWLLRLPTPAELSAAAGELGAPGQAAAAAEEQEGEGRMVMEVGGEAVDLEGLTLVLSAANAAAGGELDPPEVRAAAQAIMRRCGAGKWCELVAGCACSCGTAHGSACCCTCMLGIAGLSSAAEPLPSRMPNLLAAHPHCMHKQVWRVAGGGAAAACAP